MQSCGDKGLEQLNNTAVFKNEIQSYGPTSLSKHGEIFIDFKQSVFPEVDEATISKYFTIEPYVKTKAYIKDGHIIVIDPIDDLVSHQQYNVLFDIKRFLRKSVPTEKLKFSVSVLPQFASLAFKDYVYFDEQWFLDVQLSLNDSESLEELSKLTTVTREGKELDFSYIIENPLKPVIRIENIKPSSTEEKIRIDFRAKKIGASANTSYDFVVPQQAELELLQTRESVANKTVTFLFNKSLDTKQNLDGFITVTGSERSPEYKIKANALTIFYELSTETQTVKLKSGIKAEDGKQLAIETEHILGKTKINPELKNVGIGHIIPSNKNVVFPFEAVGLKQVRLEVFKVHSKNLQQFYQRNTLASSYDLDYVGEVVHTEVLDLTDLTSSYEPFEKNRYHFDLKNFINADPSSLYEIRLGFLPEDVVMECAQEIKSPVGEFNFNGGYYGVYGYYSDFEWDDRDNPCKKGFYNRDRYIRKMVVNTNIGIIAKKTSQGDLIIFANDINNCNPMTGAGVFVYNKSQRELLNTKTDGEGRVFLADMEDAHMIKVTMDNKENWIRIQENEGLNLSKFRVDGRVTSDGLDGYVFSERNVWRPGDTMYVDFILHDPTDKIPENHPVTLKLYNPKGKVVHEKTSINNIGPFYTFSVPTADSYVTGDYLLQVNLGASEFGKSVKIETIKPNKFSISNNLVDNISFSEKIRNDLAKIDYNIKWLYGAPAKNKKIKVELDMDRSFINWEGYKDYEFEDPKNRFNPPSNTIVAETTTNAEGRVEVPLKLPSEITPPSLLRLNLRTTAYESSGDFSVDVSSFEYSPYSHYTGIEVPKNEYNWKRVDKDKESTINFVTLDENKQPSSGRPLSVNIYKMQNYWWYSSYNDQFVMDNSDLHVSKSDFDIVSGAAGKSSIDVTFNTYGRYYIKVCDEESGHCSADYVYVGHPWNDGEMTMAVYEEAAQLTFDATKQAYKTGETVELNVPSYFNGKALISLENGSTVVESFWTEVQRGNNKISFTAQQTMFPTIYAHVTLLQPHQDKATDMPIRSYGVLPITIEDDRLRLRPTVDVASELKPKDPYQITVSEQDGKPMYYTVAVVDEGLLNITNFTTPNPFDHFYSKPALGVRTYDLYNEVMSNYGRNIDQLFSIGGDGALPEVENVEKANRFKSVVKHIGPFFLEADAQNVHEFKMPNYIGNVRFMLVAANEEQYGSYEKNVPVKQDLMVLTTLPRTLAPGDNVNVPLTIFTMKKGMGQINYGLETSGVQTMISQGTGVYSSMNDEEKVINIEAKVGQDEGVARFFSAANNSELKSTQEIEVQVENPNPIVRRTESFYLKASEEGDYVLNPVGKNDSEYSISVSSLAPVNTEELIDRLTRYPYGCLEQRTAAAYAYLYQKDVAPDMATPAAARTIVTDHISNLYRFKQSSGYSLWPGSRRYDSWLTSFVGEFLIDSDNEGYSVSQDLLNSWINDQKAIAKNWTPTNSNNRYHDKNDRIFDQAYRLYTLAKSKNPAISEMNRLREDFDLKYDSGLLLAGAYAEAGRIDIAEEIYAGLDPSKQEKLNYYYSYGSKLRNIAIHILLYEKLGKSDEVAKAMINLNDELKRNRYMSTHTSVFVLRAIAMVSTKNGFAKSLNVEFSDGSNTVNLTSETGQLFVEDKLSANKTVQVKNKSTHGVFVEVVRRAKEDLGTETAESVSISISTKYTDENGKKIEVTELAQGTDFQMITTVKRMGAVGPNLDNLALRQAVPSGWEIVNERLSEFGDASNNGLDYQDIRDSKVHSFFSLEGRGEVTVAIKLKATYGGTYYHPKVLAESMYNDQVYAEEKGFSCKVKIE